MSEQPQKMLSIWTWTALILVTYGLILVVVGVGRLVTETPATTAQASLHADVWWPAVMIIVGIGLFFAGRKG